MISLRRAQESAHVALQTFEPRVMMSHSAGRPLDVALIDSTLPAQSELAAAVGSGARQVSFDPRTESATTALARVVALSDAVHRPLGRVMVFSHGTAGTIGLGDDVLSAAKLPQSGAAWRALGRHFARGGSIELFGCSSGAGSQGEALVKSLHRLTGATVYASDDTTGKGGNWDLEVGSNGTALPAAKALPDAAALTAYPADLLLIGVSTAPAANPNPVTGTTAALSVLGFDTLTSESNLSYTWSVTTKPTGSAVTFSANGTNAAKSSTATFTRAGTYVLSVNTYDPLNILSFPSVLTVTVSPTLTSIAVTPGSVTLNENAQQTFSATGYDQFGQALTLQPSMTWAKASGTGSVNALGVYTAPGAVGSATVTAASGGVTSVAAAVTVSDAAPTVSVAASATTVLAGNTTSSLSVLGADDGGASNLTYTWSVTSKPAGASNPTFSANGTNAAKSATATFSAAGAYTFLVTIKDAEGLTTTSSVSVTVPQGIALNANTPATVALGLGATQQFSATAYDQFGAALTNQPAFTWTALGAGTVTSGGLFTAAAAAGSAVVTASYLTYTASANVTVSNNTSITAPASPVTGTTAALSVTGASSSALTYTWSTVTAPFGAPLPTFRANGTNAAASTVATFARAGTYVLRAIVSDGLTSSVDTATVTVAQTLTTAAVTPGSAALNENGQRTFTATGYDQFGQTLAVQPTFTWSKSAGIGAVDPSTGVYTAPAAAGTATVTATSGGVSASASVTVNNAAPTVATAAAALNAVINGSSVALSALGADDGGEANLTYTWTAVGQPAGSVTFGATNGTNAGKATVATFTSGGAYTLRVTISDGTSSVTSDAAVLVVPTLTLLNAVPSSPTVPEHGQVSVTLGGLDQFGHALSLPTPTWAVASGGGTIDASGTYTAGTSAGSVTITGSVLGLSASVTINVVNGTPTVASPATIVPASQTATTAGLTVRGTDDGTEANLTYTWSTFAKPAGAADATFSANGTHAARDVTATFAKAGTYVLQATIRDAEGLTTTSSVTVIFAQQLTRVDTSPATPPTLSENATAQFSATGIDQFGDAMVLQPLVSWSTTFGSISATGLYTAPGTAGSGTVTVNAGGGVQRQFTANVADATPTIALPPSATFTSGNAATLGVLGQDDGGESHLTYAWSVDTKPADAADPTFSQNNSNAAKLSTATFTKAGTYVLRVTLTDAEGFAASATSNVTVAQTSTALHVTPTSVAIGTGAVQPFTATVTDQFGDAMTSPPALTWTATRGTVTSGGLYTASVTPGSATVTASGAGLSASATVTVSATAPTVLLPATGPLLPVTGTTAGLSVLATDPAGGGDLTYTWWLSSGPAAAPAPTFAPNGTHAAASTTVTFGAAGAYHFVVTATDANGLSTTSGTDVTVAQTRTAINVTAAAASVNENATDALTATAVDQFGNAMLSQPTFTWSMQSGGGTVSSGGLYTAPAGATTASIAASAGGLLGAVTVHVVNATPTISHAASAGALTAGGTAVPLNALGADDNGESNLTYTWSVVGLPPAAVTFDASGSNAAKGTVARFSAAGTYTLACTIDDGQGGTIQTQVTVVVPQNATSVHLTSASPALPLNGTSQLSAAVLDQFGRAITNAGTVTWSTTAGSVDAGGLFTAPNAPATAVITATVAGVGGSLSLPVINTSPVVVAPVSAQANPVTGTSVALHVGVTDDGGAAVLSYGWWVESAPAGAPAPQFANDNVTGNGDAVVTFRRAGQYRLAVTVTDAQGASTTSDLLVTVAQTATSLTLSPVAPSLHEGGTQQLTATALDQFGDALASQPSITWSVTGGGSVNASGLFTAGNHAGTSTVTAAWGAFSTTLSATVTDAAPTLASPASSNASNGHAAGTGVNLSALGADDGLGEAGLTYTWATLAKPAGAAAPAFAANANHAAHSTMATFTSAGSYTFEVTIADAEGQSVTSDVTVTVDQTPTSIAVSPSTAPTLRPSQSQRFTATSLDQFGAPLSVAPTVTWSASRGTVAADGTYTAPSTAGSATVTVTAGTLTRSFTVATALDVPTITSPATGPQQPVTGLTATLHVAATNTNGGSDLTYTWSVDAKPTGAADPVFSRNGTVDATDPTVTFSQAGAYQLLVTIRSTDGSTAVSTAGVTVDQALSAVSITPPAPQMTGGDSTTFAAVALDQFGDALAAQPVATWSASAGTISSSGAFTAPQSPGDVTVTATVAGTGGVVHVTVTAALPPTLTTPAAAGATSADGTSVNLTVAGQASTGSGPVTYTWSLLNGPAGATPPDFSDNGTSAAAHSLATFHAVGTYDLLATITDALGRTTTSTVTVTIDAVVTSVGVTAPTTTLDRNDAVQLSAVAYDGFGHVVASHPAFAWSGVGPITVDGSTGLVSSGDALGTAVVTARGPGGISASAALEVINQAPLIVTQLTAAQSVVSGTGTALALSASDDAGADLTYTWSTVTKPAGAAGPVFHSIPNVAVPAGGSGAVAHSTYAAVEFAAAGDYELAVTATDAQGAWVTSTVDVSVTQTLGDVRLAPGVAAVNAGSHTTFTLEGVDQFGDAMPLGATAVNYTASGGTISPSGVFTAPATAGVASIAAATTDGRVATAVVQVVIPSVSLRPAASLATPSATTATLATVTTITSGTLDPATLTYAWTTLSRPAKATDPTIVAGNAAAATATLTAVGTYVFQVTAIDADGLVVGRGTATLQVAPSLAQLVASPATPTVGRDATVRFTASGLDQFGGPMALPTGTVQWYMPRTSVGRIDANGLYAAPIGGGGPAEVIAVWTPANGAGSSAARSALRTTAAVSVVADDASQTPVNYTRLSMLKTGPTSALLMWQPRWAGTFAGGFGVERWVPATTTSAAHWRSVARLPTKTTQYAVDGLRAGQTYTYRIRAYKPAGGTAARTEGVSFTMPAAAAPAPRGSRTASADLKGRSGASWSR